MAFLFDSEIDFSFAICPRRSRDRDANDNQQPQQLCNGEERTSFYQEYGDSEQHASSDNDATASSDESCRSVTFAENVVSEVKVVPRYERESVGDLFYNRW
eukprot:CAMPEP_0181102518 /NCGR_PEP_ID=MMETSP1071-20121207/14363_1 /TAXON_ID=35127 /ORGANISM="Thalassiosira sp., Strain NH16" /LENGTH=100 /DNA_ID=CAMNT_0023185507 /DNA_START=272 /DNA_END=571 /DNA_ORIENTATION=-